MGSLFSPAPTARPADPSLAEMITMRQGPRQHPAQQEAPLTRNQVMAGTQAGLELMPIIGDAIAARDAYRSGKDAFEDFAQGRLGSGAANAGMAGLSALGVLPFIPHLAGIIKAYHGSPHRFSKFSMDKIGTGEGAQAYGHGLYFAEEPDVARGYQDYFRTHADSKLTAAMDGYDPESTALRALASGDPEQFFEDQAGGTRKALARMIEKGYGERDLAPTRAMIKRYDDAKELIDSGKVALPNTNSHFYEVTLQPDHDDLLDWDAPLSEQSPKVREALEKSERGRMAISTAKTSGFGTDDPKGEEIYQALQVYGEKAKSSEALRQAGIPGIKYYDAGSRGKKSGTRNFVIFDDDLVSIDRVE